MGDEILQETECTQTQTQKSQVDWSQPNTPSFIPVIWGRLYSTKVSLNEKNCWKDTCKDNPPYYDLIQPEFSLGRSFTCTFVMRKEIINESIVKSVSKQHFIIKRNLSEPLSPAIITDLSFNGTFINGKAIGKGLSRVLDDNDRISLTHPNAKIFIYKDLLKNEQDKVPKEISKKYYISRILGQGACGLVKLVYDKTKCTKHAMKIIKKCRLTNGEVNNLTDPQRIMNEVNIMKALRHPCIVSTEEVFDTGDTVYIILELMQGGELFDRISKYGQLSEQLTKFYFRQMVVAVKYLHSQGITHRDLKPENVLLESKDEETLVKITDFGLSKFVGEDSFMKTMCGTPLYLAPEVLQANGQNCYGPDVDVWSLGVIFFVCLVGYLPFSTDYKELSLRDQILRGQYRYSNKHWSKISLPAKLLMKRMLTVNVKNRITLDQILNHTWMQDPITLMKIERLLIQAAQVRDFDQLTLSSHNSDEENNNSDQVTVLKVAVAGKRGLSDNCAPCEPIAKRLRIDACAMTRIQKDDTSTTNSCSSTD
ncbi:PREDICTED: ovarian-specific serine/threonine-protein kinase Lok-like [Papilio xuthus]|uniref:Ovarian-specific serine/threonine-protein kinase Lok n=1 Tax=Papilio xuthus TaxID=66420 RepID=A0A194PLY2_PAPXU|nr:PREDICTED: ovarian-specific serine/threonine-protein kinase Lok-like [Papilio xuthus]KPI94446.1 Ovarian-specific serine/threonine-protein kinase Lok [Papilio xuthus]